MWEKFPIEPRMKTAFFFSPADSPLHCLCPLSMRKFIIYCALGQDHYCGLDMLLASGKGRGEWHDEQFLDLVTTETR